MYISCRFGKNIFNVAIPSQDLFETESSDFDDPFTLIFGVIKDGFMKKIIPYLKVRLQYHNCNYIKFQKLIL